MASAAALPRTNDERLDEVARLLALGILRLRARDKGKKANDPNRQSDFGVDFASERSVSAIEQRTAEKADD